MLFGKKKKPVENISTDEIKRMASSGMSDKEIIRDLKGRGYSYESIEKSMLSAVKDGVDSPRPDMQFANPPQEEYYAPPAPAPPPAAAPMYDTPSFNQAYDQQQPQEMDLENGQALLEELVEGVIQEKWQKFETRVEKIEETFERIRAEIKQFEGRIEQQKQSSPMREMDARFSELSQQLEDFDARVGGLEKAFKQFLPSLTRNIEALSTMIHEMKDKSHLLEEEV